MGFARVSGLPMGTRSGDVPIDVLFYLLRGKKFDDAGLEKSRSCVNAVWRPPQRGGSRLGLEVTAKMASP